MMRASLWMIAAALVAAPVSAQSAEEEALHVVEAMFDALKAKDAAAMGATMHESMTLAQTGTTPEGAPSVRTVDRAQFLEAISSSQADLEEVIWDPVVQQRDNLASVWVKYAFYVDGEMSHCGVDTFTLARTAEGWKILHVADTQQREDCWEPPGPLR